MLGHGGLRTKPGSHISKFYASWNSAVEAAGFKGLLFHDLRRSATRSMRKAGIDQAIRMKISGHKTDSMERRYNIVGLADVKDVAKNDGELDEKSEGQAAGRLRCHLRPTAQTRQ